MKYLAIIAIILLALVGFTFTAKAATILFPTGGGTGWGNLEQYSVLLGNGTGKIATTSPSTSGYVLTSNGASSFPTFQAIPASGGGSGNVATSSAETSTYIPFWTSTAGTPATLSGGTSNFTWDGTKLFASQASTTQLSVSGNTYFPSGIWNSSGNVGIGTNTPTRTLEVNGVIGAGNAADGVVMMAGSGVGSVVGVDMRSNAYNNLELRAGASGTGIVVATSGNVGVGTTSPARRLTIANQSGDSSLRIDSLVANNAYLEFSKGGVVKWQLTSDANSNNLNFNEGSSNSRITIQSGGNVGIGTTSPEKLVHLYQTGTVATSLKVEGSVSSSDYSSANILLQSNETGANFRALGTYYYNTGGSNEWYSGRPYSTSDMFIIGRQTGVTKATSGGSSAQLANALFTITSAGNVGIGSTSPSVKLAVVGNGSGTGRAFSFAANNGVEKFIVQDNGYTGIGGIASPVGQLHVVNGFDISSTGGQIYFGESANYYGRIGFDEGGSTGLSFDTNYGDASSVMSFRLGGSEKFKVLGSNFGIGTTTPASKLSVQGNALFSGNLSLANLTATGTARLSALATPAGSLLAVNASGDIIATTSPAGAVSSVSNSDSTLTISPTTGAVVASLNLGKANTWSALQQFTANASSTQLSVYGGTYLGGTATTTVTSAGRVGIGSSTPAAQLGINAIAGVPALMIGSSTTLAQVDTNGKLQVLDTGTSYNGVVSPLRQLVFAPATSTAWSGTTTGPYIKKVVIPYAATIRQVICETDTGTLGVDLYHTSTHLAYLNASTTKGTFKFTSNNTLTAGETLYMVAGTPVSSPTSVTCTVGITETP